jgi:taurine--2-oxoglutarate transaminase
MDRLAAFFRENGFYTFIHWNTVFTCPPLIITEGQLKEAFAILDRGLEITDHSVVE